MKKENELIYTLDSAGRLEDCVSCVVGGVSIFVSLQDAERFQYGALSISRDGYARQNALCTDGKSRCVEIHRILLPKVDGLEIDHINGIRVDNQRSNLRYCTRFENQRNRREHRAGATPNICLHSSGKWRCRVNLGGSEISVGLFDTREGAMDQLAQVNAVLACGGSVEDIKQLRKPPKGYYYSQAKQRWIVSFEDPISKRKRHLGSYISEQDARDRLTSYRKTGL